MGFEQFSGQRLLERIHRSDPIRGFGSFRHYRGWQFISLFLFVLVLVLSETVLVLEKKYGDFIVKQAKYWRSSFL
jgi:hypothetical protein